MLNDKIFRNFYALNLYLNWFFLSVPLKFIALDSLNFLRQFVTDPIEAPNPLDTSLERNHLFLFFFKNI
mgnify:CR=1 FL=1